MSRSLIAPFRSGGRCLAASLVILLGIPLQPLAAQTPAERSPAGETEEALTPEETPLPLRSFAVEHTVLVRPGDPSAAWTETLRPDWAQSAEDARAKARRLRISGWTLLGTGVASFASALTLSFSYDRSLYNEPGSFGSGPTPADFRRRDRIWRSAISLYSAAPTLIISSLGPLVRARRIQRYAESLEAEGANLYFPPLWARSPELLERRIAQRRRSGIALTTVGGAATLTGLALLITSATKLSDRAEPEPAICLPGVHEEGDCSVYYGEDDPRSMHAGGYASLGGLVSTVGVSLLTPGLLRLARQRDLRAYREHGRGAQLTGLGLAPALDDDGHMAGGTMQLGLSF